MADEALRRGDLVEVRSASEILATLDEDGSLDGLPFMPEMAAFCGRTFVVERRADRICDTVDYTGSRRLPQAVLLADLRCDGSGHGGCQAECRLFWKEAWLKRVSYEAAASPHTAPDPGLAALLERTRRTARRRVEAGTTPEPWRCQATELPHASGHVKSWDPRSYVREYATGNVDLGRFLRVTARAAITEPKRKLGLVPKVHLRGTRTQPGSDPPLNLRPGELVQVKTKEEIAATLSPKGKHRGLWFDREMLPFCGRVFRVRRRIDRIIDERDGRMIEIKNDCVTLEGVVCSGDLSVMRWFCPRAIYPYWRECWLRRIDARSEADVAEGSTEGNAEAGPPACPGQP
jgi:hypothetical protein